MKTDDENVWHKHVVIQGSCSEKIPQTSTWSATVRWLVSHVLILTASCRLWVKSILQQVEPLSFGATQQAPGCRHLWCVLVSMDATLTGTCSEAHQAVVTLGMVLRSLTKLHPDRHSLALTLSCDCTLGVKLAAWLNYIRTWWFGFSSTLSNR